MLQVLTDLCNVSGPFSKVLGTLRDELVRSVYSNYYAMEQQGLQFSQLPYYKAAERLEADNKHLLQEKDAFKKVLLQRQVLHNVLAPSKLRARVPSWKRGKAQQHLQLCMPSSVHHDHRPIDCLFSFQLGVKIQHKHANEDAQPYPCAMLGAVQPFNVQPAEW